MKRKLSEHMDFEEKKELYKTLNKEQKRELKELSKYFDSKLWFVEPCEEKFGIKWYQGELREIL